MTRIREFALPDLGEGLTEGEILQWLVSPGDTVRLNQPLVEVETAKAAVEIPSPFAGVVAELLAAAGATVDVGATIVRFDTEPHAGPLPEAEGAAAVQAAGAAANPAESSSRVAAEATAAPAEDWAFGAATSAPHTPAGAGREAVLVGYGVRPGAARRRPRLPTSAPPAAAPPAPARVSAAAVAEAAELSAAGRVLAKPPVRKLAKDLGVDLGRVTGSGPGGAVTRDDVEAAATAWKDGVRVAAAPTVAAASDASDASVPAPERRVPVTGVRKATARAMVASAFTAPHVTLFLTVDVTPSVELVQRLRALKEFEGVSVTPLLLVARALVLACRRYPEVNASWDEAAQEIVVHAGVGLGIAAATPRGLLVPTIKGADQLSLVELAKALQHLTITARAGRSTPADMTGGTITITNIGSFGVDAGTPILNPGEAAILCLGAVREQPWVHDGQLAVRRVTQLSLSVDHRLVDGELASRVLADIGAALADPTLLLAWF